jgi:hypothetical protein
MKGFYAKFDGIPYTIEIESVNFGVGRNFHGGKARGACSLFFFPPTGWSG